MLSREEYTRISMEINLFFQRIMKEHLFFVETNLPPVEADNIAKAKELKQSFEQLLADTVYYANGTISEYAIRSNEFVTSYTLKAEDVTKRLTGAKINSQITKAELKLECNTKRNSELSDNIAYSINSKALQLVNEVIAFQKSLLVLQLQCKVYSTMYPEMLEHNTREAIYYSTLLQALLNRELPRNTLNDELSFWNNIMGEHAQFVDGMLDPTEKPLKELSEDTAERFERLVEECIQVSEKQIIQKSFEATGGIREFKRSAIEGLLACKIKSIIPPLLADHVLREANHYYRLLAVLKG